MGEADVVSPPSVPDKDGTYWVPGDTRLKSGQAAQSVFRVDTNSGGELLSVYWFIDSNWYEHQDADAYARLGVSRDDVFPFDWTYGIPLDRGVYHD
jgi:hypothetical protein